MGEGHIQGLLVEMPEVGSAFAGTNVTLGQMADHIIFCREIS